MKVKNARSTWGRARFGGGAVALLGAALAIGVLLSAGLGGLFSWLGDGENGLLEFTVMAFCTLPVTSAFGWGMLVDRSTLNGAPEKPEDSIESAWYGKAASGAFGDILLVGGLGSVAFTFTRFEAAAGLVLAGVVGFAMLDFAARYFRLKKAAA